MEISYFTSLSSHLLKNISFMLCLPSIFLVANPEAEQVLSTTFFHCCLFVPPSHTDYIVRLSPLYDDLDHTKHMFYKSLSSGDDNGEDKDIQKDNETDKYMVDMRDMVDKDKDMVDIGMVDNGHGHGGYGHGGHGGHGHGGHGHGGHGHGGHRQ